MPNLVGIGLSQVPTNSMLGGMAYQDPDRVKIKKLNVDEISQINSEIVDTAVDVFIYDTSKDSDGGAWRKRTQHTSWYNETLGTEIRGTRREFPSVAVIVIESEHLKIYDGDDPSLPMWMVFEHGVQHILGCNGDNLWSVVALNGIIVVGENESYGGVVQIKFISDTAVRLRGTLTTNGTNGRWLGNIQERNDGYGDARGYDNDSSYDQLVADNVNDVSVTVLPNAPIDPGTGLPTPTIAAATDGGVSVIKDDGSVVDITAASGSGYNNSDFISIANDGFLVFPQHGSGSSGEYSLMTIPIPDSNRTTLTNSGNPDDKYIFNDTNAALTSLPHGLGVTQNGALRIPGTQFLNYPNGLAILSEKASSRGDAMVDYITTDYNTGWMHGDIKGAFLSSIDATNLVYTDILGGKGTFDDASYWTAGASWTVSGGVATSNSSGISYLTKNGILTTDARYTITLTVSSYSAGTLYVYCGTGAPGNANHYRDISANGTYTFVLDAYNTNFGLYGSNFGGVVDNLTISSVVDYDHSIHSKNLGVIGTITKQPVATGAELVYYKGTTASTDRLELGYSNNYDFGTGDFSVMFWVKADAYPAAWQRMFERLGGENFLTIRIHPQDNGTYQGEVMFKFGSAGWAATNYSIVGKGWLCIVFTRVSGTSKMYVNGVEKYSTTSHNGTVNNGATGFMIDNNSIQLSLLRVSSSTPDIEQIKKIYNDERHLFKENAKCTLYGSSNDVKALAYDESTEQLHVGTSSGRSDFQGLRRINNTTTAVTTAISAHDGFIVEQ